MKFLIIGYGSIGKRHANNLKFILKSERDIIIYRQPGEKKVPGLKTFFNLKDALSEKPNAVVIATPTNSHIPIALKCAKAGTHLFIEKPVSNNLKDIKKLTKLIKRNNLITMIGCCLRFHPGLKHTKDLIAEKTIGKIISVIAQAGQYLPDWRAGVKYQNTYSAKKSLGGGVVLDLIHELDYLYWLFGEVKSVFAFTGKSSNLTIDTEDIAD
ncbi:MAG TPA: Gfo/Idh/MocA family oxidoreductase, partial [Candidatus Parcubacteria bacterium]|nr:Gfo/Idh/MocA family oxidoreductase [Candidatus Parcubacteria bacterium]